MNNIFQQFKLLSSQFIVFLKYPDRGIYPELTLKQKLINTCLYLAIIDFFMSISLWLLTEFTEKVRLFHPLETRNDTKFSIIEMVIIGVLISPLLEELLFRYPLKFVIDKKYSRWLIILFCIGFGLIHLTNYKIDSSHIPFIPLIVIVQIYGGFMFSFIRLKYGFWYSVLLHVIHNVWGITLQNAIKTYL